MKNITSKGTGTIVQVMGPVVDVEFTSDVKPFIRDALTVKVDDEIRVMEVAQLLDGNTVRCIMLSASEGLSKHMKVGAAVVSARGSPQSFVCAAGASLPPLAS